MVLSLEHYTSWLHLAEVSLSPLLAPGATSQKPVPLVATRTEVPMAERLASLRAVSGPEGLRHLRPVAISHRDNPTASNPASARKHGISLFARSFEDLDLPQEDEIFTGTDERLTEHLLGRVVADDFNAFGKIFAS